MREGARGIERKSLLRSPLTPSPSFFSRFDLGSAPQKTYRKKPPATQATTDMTLNCEK